MNNLSGQILELIEYAPRAFPRSAIPEELGQRLWRDYGAQVAVEFPSPKTNNQWVFTVQGWVGYIPLSSEVSLLLRPKVPLSNIFRMWEYAYRLKSFQFPEGLYDSKSLEEFYERLAHILALKVLDRARRGLYRAYTPRSERLPFVRGRMRLQGQLAAPWKLRMACEYEEHTADLEENQLISWTIHGIARSGRCSERVAPVVRQAFQALQGAVDLTPFAPEACVGRTYNRLNEDYRVMHALCRFFLDQHGPQHDIGDRAMLPFLVDMDRLYELFVAEWLRANISTEYSVRPHERVHIGDSELYFDLDLLLSNAITGKARCIIDTKYKYPNSPSADDIAQVVAYAHSLNCHEAVLLYPAMLSKPMDTIVNGIRLRTLTFDLSQEIGSAGQFFLKNLFVGE